MSADDKAASDTAQATRRAGAVLTVDLGAIAANWRGLRDAGRAEGKPIDCAAVLKADAYGTGASVVGPRLAADGCRQFFVAHIDEGIALRRVLPELPIYVLNGLLAGTEPDFVEHGLTPVLNHLGQLNAWRAAAQRVGHLPWPGLPLRPAASRSRALRHQSPARPAQPDAADGDAERAHPAKPSN